MLLRERERGRGRRLRLRSEMSDVREGSEVNL